MLAVAVDRTFTSGRGGGRGGGERKTFSDVKFSQLVGPNREIIFNSKIFPIYNTYVHFTCIHSILTYLNSQTQAF